jgi:carboxyl-terminal processing protease
MIAFIDSAKWLTIYEAAICVINLIVLIRYAIAVQRRVRWLDYAPGAGLLVAIASYVNGDATLPALVLYVLTLTIFLCTVHRIWRPAPVKSGLKRRILRFIICSCGVLPIVFVFAVAGEMRYNPVSDVRHMSYADAFMEMNKRLSLEYPFGEWKKIDWNELMITYEPQFVRADKEKDPSLYYKTLRDYLHSLRDGHIDIVNDQLYDKNPVFRSEVGGGFGISAVQLDDGRVLVSLVLKDSPAQQKGIRLGAEIIKWNGQSAGDAYRSTSWSDIQPSTTEVNMENQGRFMVRASIGQKVQVEFRNRDSNVTRIASLTAYDDQYETLKKTRVKLTKADLDVSPIEGKVLVNGYGYVRIKHFLATSLFPNPEIELKQTIQMLQDRKVKGLIIDLRNNPGGEDELAAKMAGYFIRTEKHYEHVSYYNRYTKAFELNQQETIRVKPSKYSYTGKIAVLINSRTGSSGEGIPLLLKGQSHVVIVGFTATNGSFGILSRPITIDMPEGYVVQFPDGRSLNEDKEIQLDSNDRGEGGVAPDIKIPLTEETFADKYVRGEDIELNVAVSALETWAT